MTTSDVPTAEDILDSMERSMALLRRRARDVVQLSRERDQIVASMASRTTDPDISERPAEPPAEALDAASADATAPIGSVDGPAAIHGESIPTEDDARAAPPSERSAAAVPGGAEDGAEITPPVALSTAPSWESVAPATEVPETDVPQDAPAVADPLPEAIATTGDDAPVEQHAPPSPETPTDSASPEVAPWESPVLERVEAPGNPLAGGPDALDEAHQDAGPTGDPFDPVAPGESRYLSDTDGENPTSFTPEENDGDSPFASAFQEHVEEVGGSLDTGPPFDLDNPPEPTSYRPRAFQSGDGAPMATETSTEDIEAVPDDPPSAATAQDAPPSELMPATSPAASADLSATWEDFTGGAEEPGAPPPSSTSRLRDLVAQAQQAERSHSDAPSTDFDIPSLDEPAESRYGKQSAKLPTVGKSPEERSADVAALRSTFTAGKDKKGPEAEPAPSDRVDKKAAKKAARAASKAEKAESKRSKRRD